MNDEKASVMAEYRRLGYLLEQAQQLMAELTGAAIRSGAPTNVGMLAASREAVDAIRKAADSVSAAAECAGSSAWAVVPAAMASAGGACSVALDDVLEYLLLRGGARDTESTPCSVVPVVTRRAQSAAITFDVRTAEGASACATFREAHRLLTAVVTRESLEQTTLIYHGGEAEQAYRDAVALMRRPEESAPS